MKDKLKEFGEGLGEGFSMTSFGDTPEDTKPEETKPEETKPGETKPEETKPGETKPEETKPGETKPEETKPEETKPSETLGDDGVTTLLNETFGGKYKDVAELKADDILGKLKELEELRDANATLKTQIENPVAGFANDDVAKFNQFVKDTGNNDYVVFDKLNKASLDNTDSVDILVLKQIIDNPNFIGQETKLKKMLIKKYNVNPEDVENEKLSEEDLELNKLSMNADAEKARKDLVELKGKIRMPEKPEPPIQTKIKPSKEELDLNREKWGMVVGNMNNVFKELFFYPEGKKNKDGTDKEPFKFTVTDESKKEIIKYSIDYCVENQFEPNKENVVKVSDVILDKYIRNNLNSILKVHGDEVAGRVKKEVEEEYEHPSKLKTGEQPPVQTLDDDGVEQAYKAEMEG